ncbi:hypothetical protein A4U64_01055 [Rhodococcus sp. WB1]|uniref:STAS/SEC14 domain-containing protein n=1 Tax=Rhodococcus aetherivorans TaxID=191292 RepID=A0AA46P5L9_9NOCA|nr:STAS/SEC14 domain-containing protein [Rhodococcus aetherivorans]ANZ23445.1 hypothetical protein A4U64_01055 [Rhodococcus sp. WB1]UYF95070.1 STAS/SEC14 domain-containing protein [Rhodococcus aetherivorans]
MVFERCDGISAGAWEDLEVGVAHLTRGTRIAWFTDQVITVISLFGGMTPGDLGRFPVAARGDPIAWAAQVGGWHVGTDTRAAGRTGAMMHFFPSGGRSRVLGRWPDIHSRQSFPAEHTGTA